MPCRDRSIIQQTTFAVATVAAFMQPVNVNLDSTVLRASIRYDVRTIASTATAMVVAYGANATATTAMMGLTVGTPHSGTGMPLLVLLVMLAPQLP